jgi:CheY-like chemotaxis protein
MAKERSMSEPQLHARRLLVVEDNLLNGQFMRQILSDLGYGVIGPVDTLDETLRVIETVPIDGAVMDVRLGEANIQPAASELARREIPFILATGLGGGAGELGEPLASAPTLVKPFSLRRFEELVRDTFPATRDSDQG